jgi:hypothetical protein
VAHATGRAGPGSQRRRARARPLLPRAVRSGPRRPWSHHDGHYDVTTMVGSWAKGPAAVRCPLQDEPPPYRLREGRRAAVRRGPRSVRRPVDGGRTASKPVDLDLWTCPPGRGQSRYLRQRGRALDSEARGPRPGRSRGPAAQPGTTGIDLEGLGVSEEGGSGRRGAARAPN